MNRAILLHVFLDGDERSSNFIKKNAQYFTKNEPVLFNLFSKRVLFMLRKMWGGEVFLTKLYFKATNK